MEASDGDGGDVGDHGRDKEAPWNSNDGCGPNFNKRNGYYRERQQVFATRAAYHIRFVTQAPQTAFPTIPLSSLFFFRDKLTTAKELLSFITQHFDQLHDGLSEVNVKGSM